MDGQFPTHSSFGEMLKALRLRQHMKQQELATLLGVHRNTISGWECGDYLPESRTMMLELAQHLHLKEQETRQLLEASFTGLSPYWHLPFPRNPFFTGREGIMHTLHAQLHSDQAVAITQTYALHGLGGIGKTQVALEYAYRHALEYTAIFWIGAETTESIAASFFSIADVLALPERREKDQREVVAAVQRWLNTHRQWLLIWDNVEDLTLLLPFLPSAWQGAQVFTTRCHTLGALAHSMELLPMTEEEGVLFLLRRSRLVDSTLSDEQIKQRVRDLPDESAIAHMLVQVMGGLPLALDQVGAYIEETLSSLQDYFSLYQTMRATLLGRRGAAILDHPASVVTTLSLSFEKVERASTAAADLLRLCAFLHSDGLPEEILTEGAAHLGEQLEALAADALQLNEAIRMASAYSLLKRTAKEHTLSMHRLVQAVLRDTMDTATELRWIERVICTVNAACPETTFENWPHCERWLPQAQACRQLIAQSGSSLPQIMPNAVALLFRVGNYLLERGRYTEAEPFLVQAIALGEQQINPILPELATCIDRLAELYWRQNRYEQAESLWERALALREQQLGTDHPETAESLNNLGALYWNQGRHSQAEQLWKRALSLREQQLGADHPLTAESLNNLAFLYRNQERFEQAEPLLQRALAIREQQLGADHPLTALTLSSLGLLHHYQGKEEQAESLLQRALTIHERLLGPDDPQTALSLERLAEFYQERGEERHAEALWRRCLAIRQRQFGLDHLSTASCQLALALLTVRADNDQEIEREALHALTIYEQRLGPAHQETAVSLSRVALLYQKQGKYKQAQEMYQRAFSIFEQHRLAPTHRRVMQARENYALLLSLFPGVSNSLTTCIGGDT